MTNQDLQARRQAVVPNGLATAFPIFAEKAQNAELWDVEGNRYIDFIGGISVLNTRHSHPKIVKAVTEQVEKFSHTAARNQSALLIYLVATPTPTFQM